MGGHGDRGITVSLVVGEDLFGSVFTLAAHVDGTKGDTLLRVGWGVDDALQVLGLGCGDLVAGCGDEVDACLGEGDGLVAIVGDDEADGHDTVSGIVELEELGAAAGERLGGDGDMLGGMGVDIGIGGGSWRGWRGLVCGVRSAGGDGEQKCCGAW